MRKLCKHGMAFCLLVGLLVAATWAQGAEPTPDDGGLPTIKLVYERGIDDLPFYVGVEEGFFKEAGVNVELVFIKGEQNILAAALKGDIAGGVISLASLCKLTEKQVPIKVVSWLGQCASGHQVRHPCGRGHEVQDPGGYQGACALRPAAASTPRPCCAKPPPWAATR